ncbi:MFS transporter [Solihabitans fulvus]|uniref:MFS transporter n=2 Tax=Solihabitans fulvus TaxID=1892852 RepID=A0A5B2XWZ1_9PSEU|nr:MFS transporter [Solihabitans fulvus]
MAEPAEEPRAIAEPVDAPTARRDFGMLWAGQSTSLLGDQFMVVALPLLAVTVLGTSNAQAALLPFALFLPFLPLGLPAGAILDRLRRRPTLIVCDTIQAACFLTVALLAWRHLLPFWLLMLLVGVSGCTTVFFQVAYNSYLPTLFADPRNLHRGNARLFFSESVSRSLGPVLAGPLIQFFGVVAAVFVNGVTRAVSVVSLLGIRHREERPPAVERERGWLVREIREGLRFVFGHPLLEPVLSCGSVYVLFLSMIDAIIVLYCKDVLHLNASWIGLVVGAAALGFPVGNMLSGRLIERWGTPRTLVFGAFVSVTGIVLMPIAGSAGSAVGLVAGSIVHGVGEGSFGPTSLTLRQTVTPQGLLGRVNSVQRFLLWGAVPVGSLFASLSIKLAGLSWAMWIGALGTVLCLPPLVRRGVLADLRGRRRAAEPAAPTS